jgi:dTDP-4-dehydrorhamnose 3,5-epimerase
MQITRTSLDGVAVVETPVFADDRGWFTESFNERAFDSALRQAGLPPPGRFVQDNHSCSRKGVLRGLHYQLAPYAQAKLVRVVCGAAFDVAVDIRSGSPTFGRWFGIELSAENRRQVWIPEGFAHGFVALAESTEFLYKTTAYYTREFERSLAWNDASIGIAWPLSGSLQVSTKDAAASTLAAAVERGEVFFA